MDMHCHVSEGSPDSHVGIKEYIRSLKAQGYGGMLVTDHDSYSGYKYYEKCLKGHVADDFVVLQGIEYDTVDAGHIIVILPTGVRLDVLEHKGLPLQTLIRLVHAYGGVLGPAHPCGEPFLSIFSTGKYKKKSQIDKLLGENKGCFDFIEGFNSGEDPWCNDEATELGKRYNRPTTGGADAHELECVGLAYTILQEDISNENELIAYIKARKPMECGGSLFNGTIKAHLGKWNKLLVYGFYPYNKFGALLHAKKRWELLAKIRKDLYKRYL